MKSFYRSKGMMAMLLSVIAIGLNSCGDSGETEVDYIPVQTSEDGSWTFIDAEGNRVGNQEW